MSEILLGHIEATKQWQADLIDTLYQRNWQIQNENDLKDFSDKLSDSAQLQRDQLIKSKILERLRFPEMDGRYERILDAHKRTFNWIFSAAEHETSWERSADEAVPLEQAGYRAPRLQKTLVNCGGQPGGLLESKADRTWGCFPCWLQGQESLYWITGKPGSGKSTLMKYLYDDSRTLQHLQAWGSNLAIAGFFFWNSGTSMQMSQKGLLQALLHGCLAQCPHLIPTLFPDRWASYYLFGDDLHPWTYSELSRAFRNLTLEESIHFVFFIDGLDEFEGNSSELVNFIISARSQRNIKICAASRPWLIFEDAFGHQPRLKLENLTFQDIKLFVSETLRGGARFAELERMDSLHALQLIDGIAEKASGVFLWVDLVVRSLLDGLRDGDRISDLQKRLLYLPADLEKLFQHMLDTLEPLYFDQAFQLFQIFRATWAPISLLSMSFAEEGLEAALRAPLGPLSTEEVAFRAETMRRRLSSRCKGFLEVPPVRNKTHAATAKVQYFHRTVKDFLTKETVWSDMLSRTSCSFDPHLALCASCLMELKTLPPHSNILNRLWFIIQQGIDHVKKATGPVPSQISFLDELNTATSQLIDKSYELSPYIRPRVTILMERDEILQEREIPLHWTSTSLIAVSNSSFHGHLTSFFDLAFTSGLHSYTDSKLKQATLFTAINPSLDPIIIKLLLEHGADPNSAENGSTPWQRVLQKARANDHPEVWGESVELFLNHGADPWATVEAVSLDHIIRSSDLYSWDPEQGDSLLAKLNDLQEKGKISKGVSPGGLASVFKRSRRKQPNTMSKPKRPSSIFNMLNRNAALETTSSDA
jgi:hypothetical protein